MKRKAGRPGAECGVVDKPKILVAEATKEIAMTHSYRLHYFHLIWSTKGRLRSITSDVQSRLYPYLLNF